MGRVYTVLFPFGGIGGGAIGFREATASLFGTEARFEVLGGIDFNDGACKDFTYLVRAPSLCADIATMTPADVRRAFGDVAPDVVFGSPPCKGASGLLSNANAKTPKYQAMNELALVWADLMLKAWPEPPRLVLLENVPRLKSRASSMVKKYCALLRRAGYVFHDGFHDCGELGGLAQHRRRLLIVARHERRVPPLLYQPPKKRVRACGEVLGELPMPGHESAGPMHRLPRISWLNWVRLALIPAGGDWRDIPGVLEDGQERREKFKRDAVEAWAKPTGTVGGPGGNGVKNVADPRPFGNVNRVTPWEEPVGTITHSPAPSSGGGAVADPRIPLPCANNPRAHNNKCRVEDWDKPSHTVIGATRPGSGAPSVADPRPREWFRVVTGNARPSTGPFSVADPRVGRAFDHGYAVLPWEKPSFTVAGGSAVGQGAYSVADPRVESEPRSGAYGVQDWKEPSGTVTGAARHDNGPFSVGDPRVERDARTGTYGVLSWEQASKTITGEAFPSNGAFSVADPRKPPENVPLIIAADGTWHRPLTTLELAALQGFPTRVDDAPLILSGVSHSAWRERIGNAVPPPTARAIAERMLITLLQADLECFALGSDGAVWVRPDGSALRARVTTWSEVA